MLKRSCFSSEGYLNSFRIVMSGYSGPSSQVLSNSAGPPEKGKCGNERVPKEESPSKGVIWYDDRRVWGIQFSYSNSQMTMLIG